MKKVALGDLVAVNDVPDGQVYVVKELVGTRGAVLMYKAGDRLCNGGEMGISCLQKPTKEQLSHALNYFYK